MKTLLLIFLTFLSASGQFISKVDSIVTSSMDEMKVPGAIITIVKDGEVILNKGYGFEDIEKQIPVDENKSLFRTASITKTFTALAIMDFVDKGRLDLHQDISELIDLEEFSFKLKYPISLHHILTHSAGFEYSDFRLSKEAEQDGLLETFAKTSIPNQVYKPGTIFSYSNHAFSILGYLIEELSGEKYEDYMDNFIREKIGMFSSTFYQHRKEKPLDNAVTPYQWKDGKFIELERQFVRNPSASTLNSTGSDMALFLKTMLDTSQRILSKESFADLLSDQFLTPYPAEAHAYGIGRGSVNGMRSYSHGGGIRGFLSVYEFIPEENLGIFIAQSTRYGAEYFLWKIRGEIYKELISKEEVKKKVVMDATELSQVAYKYEGVYQQYSVTQSTFEKASRIFGIEEVRVKDMKNGSLKIGDYEYRPIGNHAFQSASEGRFRQVGFVMGEKGRAKYLVSHLHSTQKRVPFWQRVLFVQIFLGISLLILIERIVIRPFLRRKNNAKLATNATAKWIFYTSLTYISGFLILLIQNLFNASIYHGPSLGFKLGLFLISLGGIASLYSPIALFQNKFSSNRIYIIAIIIVSIVFWNLNLIGMKYYA